MALVDYATNVPGTPGNPITVESTDALVGPTLEGVIALVRTLQTRIASLEARVTELETNGPNPTYDGMSYLDHYPATY